MFFSIDLRFACMFSCSFLLLSALFDIRSVSTRIPDWLALSVLGWRQLIFVMTASCHTQRLSGMVTDYSYLITRCLPRLQTSDWLRQRECNNLIELYLLCMHLQTPRETWLSGDACFPSLTFCNIDAHHSNNCISNRIIFISIFLYFFFYLFNTVNCCSVCILTGLREGLIFSLV